MAKLAQISEKIKDAKELLFIRNCWRLEAGGNLD
jgi:hypothetical protein